jgi:hypothetical protein
VLENRHHPGAAVGDRLEPVKRLERLHHRLLHQVLGLVSIPFEPQRQMEQPVDVRQSFRLKGGPRLDLWLGD